jgi:hypothetical protein
MIRQLVLATLVLLAITAENTPAQEPCQLPLGTNLSAPQDFGSEYPLVDIMSCARGWLSHNTHWISGGINLWDTGIVGQIPVDSQGYPLELPYPIAGQETDQIVRTVWANTFQLPAGTWTVLWEGQGLLRVWGDGVSTLTNDPGRLTFDLTPTVDGLLALELEQSLLGDHVRNIRVLMPNTEATHQQEAWSTEWLSGLTPFTTLRFMDWGMTNFSPVQSWSDRALPNDYTYTHVGMPYELMIEICNRLDKDAWICVPHLADDTYIRNMARLFRDGLEPERKIYVEYSNEIWNWMFSQTHWCNDNGDQSISWPERIVPFIQNTLDLWTEEFAGEEQRLIRVAGVQASWQDVSNRIVNNLRVGSVDAVSPAAYFTFTGAGVAILEQLGSAATADTVIALARDGLETELMPSLRSQKQNLADQLGLSLIYYEGGQHLTPHPFGSVQPYGQALIDAQTLPEMGELYTALLDSLTALTSPGMPSLFANFSYITDTSARFGTWGVLQHQFQPMVSPKYQALLDHDCTSVPVAIDPGDQNAPPPSGLVLDRAAPNPFNPGTTIHFALPTPGSVTLDIYDVSGRLVRRLLDGSSHTVGPHVAYWDGRNDDGRRSASGTYYCRLATQEGQQTLKLTMVK